MQGNETTWMLASKQMLPFEFREIATEPVWSPIACQRYVCWIEKDAGVRVFEVPVDAWVPTAQDVICLDTHDLDVVPAALQKAVATAHARSNIEKWQNGKLTAQDLRTSLLAAITVEDRGVELRNSNDFRQRLENLAEEAGECFDLEVRDERAWERILHRLWGVPDEITDELDVACDEGITDEELEFADLTLSDLNGIAHDAAWQRALLENEDKTRALIARDIQLLFDTREHAILTMSQSADEAGLSEAIRALNWLQHLQYTDRSGAVELMSRLLKKLFAGVNDPRGLMTQVDETKWDQFYRDYRAQWLNEVVEKGRFALMRFDRTTPWVVGSDFDYVHAAMSEILQQLCGPFGERWTEQTQAQLLAHLITREDDAQGSGLLKSDMKSNTTGE